MKRVDTPEILDSADCPASEIEASLRDIAGINRKFGGISTSQALVDRVARATGTRRFSLLEVGSGRGEVPNRVAQNLARRGIALDVTLSDLAASHLHGVPRGSRAFAANALALPFRDNAFDLISCNLLAHHLAPDQLSQFVREAFRVSRCAILINDLVRHPLHVALVYAGFPFLQSWVSRVDGVRSVRRAYVPKEIREIVAQGFPQDAAPRVEIFRHYLFRMGIIVWKQKN
jgi:ubiquinone/menaquinone biosynthesis C-methylase UbiE